MFLSRHVRGSASAPFQLCWPFLSVPPCAPAYPAKCVEHVHFEDFLLESFSGFLKIFHPKYLAASEYSSMEIQPLKGPMEHWGSGIARGFHLHSGLQCFLSCHLMYTPVTTDLSHNKLFQDKIQLYTIDHVVLHGHAHIQAASSIMDRMSSSLLSAMHGTF